MKNKKPQRSNRTIMLTGGIVAAALMWSTSAFAFSDLAGDPAEAKINALQKSGIISGITNDTFAPKEKVTFAQGVQLIVKGLDLNLDLVKFIKKPEASDYFTKVPDNAWFAEAFIIASVHGLSLDKNIDPYGTITRAQFAQLLGEALDTKGNFPVTKMFFQISDGENLPQDIQGRLQILLNTKIIKLGEDGKFRPQDAITRSEAADWIFEASDFVRRVIQAEPEKEPVVEESHKATVTIEKVNDQVNKVVLTVEGLPNPGYKVVINEIKFASDQIATVHYSVHKPDPNMSYPQVITDGKAETYLSSYYKPLAVEQKTTDAVEPDAPDTSLMLPVGEAPTTPVENPEDLSAK
ncbi:S-layer homology domain-containing protein [Paenibacillus eucommiae]|uniref:SLH domain-containing protein n=1 Tax=Paenibacillus eucommiae TaxID=1355755 RepID=A0ABS4IXZ5_9BACL|nr:S-layer homology domain-containing protein [Paenibacillus eucommiae]MBP1992398.1 hypothetical protein [Paenibacillus eucommiae]